MNKWQTDLRGTGFVILLWVIGWGLGFGGLMELWDPHGQFGDVWPTALAILGLVGGVVFSGVLRMAESRRSFDEISLVRATAWGGIAGLALAAVAITRVAGPISSVISHVALGQAAAFCAGSDHLRAPVAIGITTALGMVAGFGSIVFFRLLARRQTHATAH